ncbi:NucA/NucB deoxyribonuclease domain-containing protein [Streptomyces sp. NPDC048383]|uniref:NucA/NucB deoxyribonuclease domain-containing protein n=1 Tax=Streptomyces sp. NPDC048383 TaxID=3155386 RepID=UPI0034420DA6
MPSIRIPIKPARTGAAIAAALLLLVLPAHQAVADTRAQTPVATTGTPFHDLIKECVDQHDLEAKGPEGWRKNRYESCSNKPMRLKLWNDRHTKLLGELHFDLQLIGYADNGARRVAHTARAVNIVPKPAAGVSSAGWRIALNFSRTIDMSNSNANPVMEAAGGAANRTDTIAGWKASSDLLNVYTSPDTGAVIDGNPQIVRGTVHLALEVTAPGAVPYIQASEVQSGVRYDTQGAPAGKHRGTVFPGARSDLKLSLRDPAVNESARHILDAQTLPDRTFPSWAGKTVPGGSTPLHRLIDQDLQEANRKAAIATCNDVWGDYSGSGLDCDEYPFSSSKEGAYAGCKLAGGQLTGCLNRYSSRLIESGDNQEAGRRIKDLYFADRLLDGDAFHVTIVP